MRADDGLTLARVEQPARVLLLDLVGVDDGAPSPQRVGVERLELRQTLLVEECLEDGDELAGRGRAARLGVVLLLVARRGRGAVDGEQAVLLALAHAVADADDQTVVDVPVARGAQRQSACDELLDDEVGHLRDGVERGRACARKQAGGLGLGRKRHCLLRIGEAALGLFEYAPQLLVVAALGGDEGAQSRVVSVNPMPRLRISATSCSLRPGRCGSWRTIARNSAFVSGACCAEAPRRRAPPRTAPAPRALAEIF